MSVTIYHKMMGENNSPIESMITNINSTTGNVNLNQNWEYYYNHNGVKKTGKQTCSLMVMSQSNNMAEVKSELEKQFGAVAAISNMLIVSKLSEAKYSNFNLPVGNYTVCLIPERVESLSNLRIMDQKPDPTLGGHFASLKINYDIKVLDKAGPYQSTRGIVVNRTSGDISMEQEGKIKVLADLTTSGNSWADIEFSLPKHVDAISNVSSYHIMYSGVSDIVFPSGTIKHSNGFNNVPSMSYEGASLSQGKYAKINSNNHTVNLKLQSGCHNFHYYAVDSKNNKSATKQIKIEVTSNNGPEMEFMSGYGKDRVVFMRDSMSSDYYKPEGSTKINNIYRITSDSGIKSTDYQVYKMTNGFSSEHSGEITEAGEYLVSYKATDLFDNTKEISFSFYVFKYSNKNAYQMIGNMTPVFMAIFRKNISEFVSGNTNKYTPVFRSSNSVTSSEAAIFPDQKETFHLTVNGDVIVENEPEVTLSNMYYDESIQKTFDSEGKFSVNMEDLFTAQGMELAKENDMKFSNGEESESFKFDMNKEIFDNSQEYTVMMDSKNIKVTAFPSSGDFKVSKTNIVFSENVSNKSDFDRIRSKKFDNFFKAESSFGIKNKMVEFGNVKMSNGSYSMKVSGSVEDLFGNKSKMMSANIVLNDKQKVNYSVAFDNSTYPELKMSSLKMSNVSENAFSGAEGFQAEEVKMEFDGKSMTGRFSNNNLISLASIKMNEENLRSLYMNKPMNMKVSFRGVEKSMKLKSSMVAVSGISPRITSYLGKKSFDAMSFGSSVAVSINESVFKNITDKVGIKSISMKDSDGKSIELKNASGKALNPLNAQTVPEVVMSHILRKEGEQEFTMTVENIVGGSSSKTFKLNVNKVNHDLIKNPAWGFIKYNNPTDTELSFMVVEKKSDKAININDASTFMKVSETSVKPGEMKMECLPSRISLNVSDGEIQKIKRCDGIEVYTVFKQGNKTLKEKVTQFNSSQLRPTVNC